MDFVKRVTTEETTDFVPVTDRIAVFDNDGTLWPEQPICIQFIFAFDRLKSPRSQPARVAEDGAIPDGARRWLE